MDEAIAERLLGTEDRTLPGYAPSWTDRLVDRIRRSRFPAWLNYAALALAVYLAVSLVVWLEGSSPPGTLTIAGYDAAGYTVIYLALIHYLDGTAGRAFDNFRPYLAGLNETTLGELRYELTTMPARRTLLAGGAGLLVTAFGLLVLQLGGGSSRIPAAPSELLILFLGNLMVATFLYHTIRQLQMVSRIHAASTQVNLFRREPAYAFSRLTARTSASWVLAFVLGVVPRASLDMTERLGPYGPIAWLSHFTLALLAFVLPLLSMQRLLRGEKRRLRVGVNQRLESMVARLNERIDGGELANAGEFKQTLDSLLLERDLINRLPTWPWNVGILAGYLSAVLLPVVIWLVQQLLSGFFPGR